MEEEHPGSKFHFSPSKWFEQWPPSLTGKRMRSRTCEAGTPNVWEFPVVSAESGESPGQPVRPGTESWARAHSSGAGVGSFLIAKREWSERGREGPSKAVTKPADANDQGRERRGVDGVSRGRTGRGFRWWETRFHYTILSTFVHGQNSLTKIKNKKSLQELKPRKEKNLKRKNPVK